MLLPDQVPEEAMMRFAELSLNRVNALISPREFQDFGSLQTKLLQPYDLTR